MNASETPAFRRAISQFGRTRRFARTAPPVALGVDAPYAAVLEAGGTGLVVSTDGVGTKAIIASTLERYDTLGIDCVAMNANDVLCAGGTPVALDVHVAGGKPLALEPLADGLVEGARQARVAITGFSFGGGGVIDPVGTAIGVVALDRVIVGQALAAGDALVGFASTGIHSNGLTLARRVAAGAGLTLATYVPEFGRSLGEELLEPTALYVDLASALRAELDVRLLAHITGDGLLNLQRHARAAEIGFVIDALPEPPAVFQALQAMGSVSDADAFREFNMGVGFCVVVPESQVERALAIADELETPGRRIGTARPAAGLVVDTGRATLRSASATRWEEA